ncbi:ras gtpase-related [Anaeramoeba flamelloides]|uniref:Ras gtpase-related n=1 Tax=Anaeramoeba flamelloides TaxID=1746091 RepID=A0ABQ8YSV3_9EUKA|nr:ras gtpase-related [Anaeramoeba flamelloides]
MTEYKLALVGKQGVGVSCLTTQFVENFFVDKYYPMVEWKYERKVEIDEEECALVILETTLYEESYSVMRDCIFKQGEGFLIVYSITSRESFEEVTKTIEAIKEIKEIEDFPMVIVGNKTDLEKDRKISQNEAMDLAKTYNCPFFETSAKNRPDVEKAFFQLVREVNLYNSKNNIKKNQSQNENQKTYKCTIF